jgi:hypothetical protein
MLKRILIGVAVIATFSACAPVRIITPINKGELQPSISLGGPMVKLFGTTIPLPLSSGSVAYGINDTYTLNNAMHFTSLAFGVIHLETSVSRNIWQSECHRMGLSTSPGFYFMIDRWDWNPKFYPMLDINFYKQYGKRNNYAYLSLSSVFELAPTKAFNQEVDSRISPYISVGNTLNGKKLSYTLELKYMNFTQGNQNLTIKYLSPANTGALGLFFGISKKF